ncbi:MAG: hypothetical protein H3C41_08245 [Bacteroidales bacterium]|nr:hypothetical protein [Bacteroidales bacterium]
MKKRRTACVSSPKNQPVSMLPGFKVWIGVSVVLSLVFALCRVTYGMNENERIALKQALMYRFRPAERVVILMQLSDEFLASAPEEALSYTNEALQISSENKFYETEVKALTNKAEIYQIKSDLSNSIDLAMQAKELAGKHHLKTQYARAILIISNCYRQLNEYKKSSELGFEALEIYEKLNDQKGICDALAAIGIFYHEQRQNEKAYSYFSRSLEIALQNNYARGISRGYNNLAVIFASKNDYENSIEYTKKAVDINMQSGLKQWLGINYNNIAEDYLDLKRYDSAFHYIEKAIAVNREINNLFNLANSYTTLSRFYRITANETQFIAATRTAMEIGYQNNFKDVLLNTSNNLQQYYFESGQTDSAYKYKSLQYLYRDSLFAENSLTRMSQLELLHKLESEEQVMKIQQQRKDFSRTLVIILLIAGIVVASLLVVRFQMKVRYARLEEQKLKDELEFKNKELAANVMSLLKKNEMLADITERLSKLEKETNNQENRTLIHKIAYDIENISQENIWEEFELRFKNVHGEFYEKLLKSYPDLSPNEQRLCAFLRLNLTTKEISNISGQSQRAIEMARFRLRKKLGIESPDVNLVTFISKI